jgi:hypothetical protein
LLTGITPPGYPAGDRRIGKETVMKALIKASIVVGLSLIAFGAAPAHADGFKNCTKIAKASWKPASEAEAAAKAAGYEVRKSKVEGSCYEVYGVKGGKLFSCFTAPKT